MLGVLRGGEEALEFLNAEHPWELGPPRARRQVEVERLPAEGVGVEELPPTGTLVARTPCPLPCDQHMVQGGTDLLRVQPVG